MKEPRERIEIRPLIAEAYPDVFGEFGVPDLCGRTDTDVFGESVFAA